MTNEVFYREYFLWIGVYHNILYDTINKTISICNRDKMSQHQGMKGVPYSKRLQQILVELFNHTCTYIPLSTTTKQTSMIYIKCQAYSSIYKSNMYKSKQLHPWLKNIHSYTHTMDDKCIFLLIMNRDISDKLCRHLIEIKRPIFPPGPPPIQSSKSMASSQDKGKLGKSINHCSRGQRDADSSMYEWGTNPLQSPCFHKFSPSNASKRLNI